MVRAKRRHVCPQNGSKRSSGMFSEREGNGCAGRGGGHWYLINVSVTRVVDAAKTNLEVVGAQRAAA